MPALSVFRPSAPRLPSTGAERTWLHLVMAWSAVLVFTLIWDFSGLDLAVMQLIGTPQGFPLQHHPLLETVLHDRLRQAASAALVLVWLWALLPARFSAVSRSDRLLAVLLATAGLIAVNLIKNRSATSCPWDWQVFGGVAEVVSHWSWGIRDGGPGRCFPGGHASSGMIFLALALPWLAPRRAGPGSAPRQRRGWQWLALALAVGLVCGAVQTWRGAHPPSHTLWTGLICGGVALAGWRPWPLPRHRAAQSPAEP